MAVGRSDTIEYISISSIFMSNRSYSFIFSCLALSFVLVFSLLVSSNAEAAGTCRSVEVSSNFPTTWTITGPGGVRVEGPDGASASTGFSVTKTSTGASLPEGDYVVSVPDTVTGGQSPYYARPNGGDGQVNPSNGAVFDCTRGTRLEVLVTYGGSTTSGGVLQYQNTPLDFDTIMMAVPRGIRAQQRILEGAFVGDHFVFHGTWCRLDMNSELNGSGLWSITENGTQVQEREICIDAGSDTNDLPSISHNLGGRMTETEGSSFVLSGNVEPGSSNSGKGPFKAVNYGFSGGQVVIESRSESDRLFLSGANGEGLPSIVGGYLVDSSDKSIIRLSDWDTVGSSPVESFFSLGNYAVGKPSRSGSNLLRQYKLENEDIIEIGTLPGNVKSPYGIAHTYDFSKSPVQLVLFDNNTAQRRLIWYKTGSSGLELVKEMSLSSDFPGAIVIGGFGVWGDYLFWPRGGDASSGSIIVGKASGSTFTKVQTVVLPHAGNPTVVLASSNGYVAIATESAIGEPSATNPAGRRNQVHIYQIGGATPPTMPPGPGTGTTTPGIAIGSLTDMMSFASSYLQLLQAVMGNIPSISPNTSFGGATSTNPAMQNVFNQALQLINSN